MDIQSKVIKSVHAKSGVDCIMQCVLQDKSCRSTNFRKTATSGGEENCELLKTVDLEEDAGSLKRNENFDHYIILSPRRVSILSEYVYTVYKQCIKLAQFSNHYGFIIK